MKIGIDVGCLAVTDKKNKTGVYQMALSLIKVLVKIGKGNHYWLYSFRPLVKEEIEEIWHERWGKDVMVKNIVAKLAFAWRYATLPIQLFKSPPDIFLGTAQALPFYLPCPAVTIIHDLAFEIFPQYYRDSAGRLKMITRAVVKKSRKLIAVSQSTKKDLVEMYQVPAEKIEVCYEGISSMFKPASEKEIIKMKKKYRIKNNYFLFLGSLKPIKNLLRIIRAYLLFCQKTGMDYQLIIAGEPSGESVDFSRLGGKRGVKRINYVDASDLPALYSGATAFVSPSLYEGFGLPHLEAMACGTPVVASNVASMTEVVGRAGVLVDPLDEAEIARAMIKITKEEKLRKDLRAKGLKKAKEFTWEKFGRKVLHILETVAKGEK